RRNGDRRDGRRQGRRDNLPLHGAAAMAGVPREHGALPCRRRAPARGQDRRLHQRGDFQRLRVRAAEPALRLCGAVFEPGQGDRLGALGAEASATGLLLKEELEDARTSMDEAAYAREYECSFDASVEGAYFASEMAAAEQAGRICLLPIDPAVKVDTAWDIGI